MQPARRLEDLLRVAQSIRQRSDDSRRDDGAVGVADELATAFQRETWRDARVPDASRPGVRRRRVPRAELSSGAGSARRSTFLFFVSGISYKLVFVI